MVLFDSVVESAERLCYNAKKRNNRCGEGKETVQEKKGARRFVNGKTLLIAGVVLLLLAAVVLLWHVNATSNQAAPALVAQVYFGGEYRVADGAWQDIVAGEHIPATEGDVTLRGRFHLLTPDGEYIGVYDGDMPIALYTDHISLTFYEGDNPPYLMDMENPLFGDSACGASWSAYRLQGAGDGPIDIVVHNPHNFGNETAVDELLGNVALWSGLDFEKGILERGESQRTVGLLFVIVSLLFLGTALFSALIHVKNSGVIALLGAITLFAGIYLSYSAEGVFFWSTSIVSNTTLLGCAMMLYMLFLSAVPVHLLGRTKRVARLAVAVLGAADALFFALPILTDILFYDTWRYWVAMQMAANVILAGCLMLEFSAEKGRRRYLCLCSLLPLLAFGIDAVMIDLGVWNIALCSIGVFAVFLIAALVMVIRIIPNNINAMAKAKELETEKRVLNAQLTESRMATMMSQIRPHFIYNTLGSIEQLCELDPPKAGELVHNFAKYLRGNFGELDNPQPILLSQEMAHVRHYVNIEKVRFPDMTFSFEMRSRDFRLPALTVQPIVENAIKHGLMKLQRGGCIRVVCYETPTEYCVSVEDDGVGFDTETLLDGKEHIGLRNIRHRLQAMVGGRLEIESRQGVGTKVLITIPKEEEE